MLKKDTLKCPNDKTPLLFELMHGMRISQMNTEEPKVLVFTARCDTCNKYFKVKAE